MQVYIFGISAVCNIHSYSFIVISKYCLHTHTASRVCVHLRTLTHSPFLSHPGQLAAQCTAAGGDESRQRASEDKNTIHIKGVPLVEHDYQPLSPESTSPPSTPSITHIGWEVRGDLLNTSWPQTDITHVFLYSSDYFSLFCTSLKTLTINRKTQTDSRSLTTISSYLYYLCINGKFMLYF